MSLFELNAPVRFVNDGRQVIIIHVNIGRTDIAVSHSADQAPYKVAHRKQRGAPNGDFTAVINDHRAGTELTAVRTGKTLVWDEVAYELDDQPVSQELLDSIEPMPEDRQPAFVFTLGDDNGKLLVLSRDRNDADGSPAFQMHLGTQGVPMKGYPAYQPSVRSRSGTSYTSPEYGTVYDHTFIGEVSVWEDKAGSEHPLTHIPRPSDYTYQMTEAGLTVTLTQQ